MTTLFRRVHKYVSPLSALSAVKAPVVLFSLLITVGTLLSGSLSAATSYYVSAQFGNDSWSGLLPAPNGSNTDGPFRTIGRAQAYMRGSLTIKTATVRAGTYSISSSWQFNFLDSGETWIAYPGESPILDGGGTGTVNAPNSTFINQLTLEGLTFQNMGAGGMNLNFGNQLTIRWNNFINCYQSCITGAAINNSVFDSNTINGQFPGNPNGNVDIGYASILLQYGSSNNKLTHNLIENVQGTGIAITAGQYSLPNNNNIVDRNIFRNISTSVVDGGAIYMLDNTHLAVGNQITNNVVNGNVGTGYWTKAYYLDGNTSNVLVSGNVCRSCGQWAYCIHVGDHNTIVNNVFDLSSGGEIGLYQTNPEGRDWGMNGNVFQRNIVYFSGAAPITLYQVNTIPSDALPDTRNNLYWSATGAYIPNSSIYPADSIIVDSNPVYADPQFAQPSAANYSMPSSSPAYSLIGFQPLVTDQGPLPGGPQGGGGTTLGSTGGNLTGSAVSSSAGVNLTALGSLDWAHWGTTSLTRKNGVNPQISSWSTVGPGAIYYANDPRPISFTDGTSPTSGTVHDGIYIYSINSGFTFTVPADTNSHTLTVLVGGWASGGTLTAHLSDGSAADFVDTTGIVNAQYDRNYTLTYRAASAGQKLTISWIQSSGNGNVTLNGAALQ